MSMKNSIKRFVLCMACLAVAIFSKSIKAEAKMSVSAGSMHTAVIKKDGSLWTCGRNDDGQLGDGTYTSRVQFIKAVQGIESVSAGRNHTAVIKKDESLWAFGSNSYGQLGISEEAIYYTYTPVKIMDNVSMVSAGYNYTAIVKKDGSLWMCGDNAHGKLGNGETEGDTDEPVRVMNNVKKVSSGTYNTGIIKMDNSLWMCGSNESGCIGNGETEGDISTPVKVMDDVADVRFGDYHTIILKTDGSVWGCGENYSGALGIGEGVVKVAKPVEIMTGVKSIRAGEEYTAIIKNDGSLWTFGDNSSGQLGNGTTYRSYTPIKIMSDVSEMDIGALHTIVVKKDQSIWSWGDNTYGQLGDGTLEQKNKPVKVISVSPKNKQVISASSKTVSRNVKTFYIGASTNGNGKLSYFSSNNNVAKVDSSGYAKVVNYGKATITIKASETEKCASAVKKIDINVVPVKMKLKSVKSTEKETIVIKWSKDISVTGYHIEASTQKNFKKNTLQREYKKNKSSAKERGWVGKKTYYFRIRAYKTVGGKKFYGPWSNVKKVKVRFKNMHL